MKPLLSSDPTLLGSYRLLGRLGSGGFGVVFKAVNENGEEVAIKLLRPEFSDDQELRLRLAREAKALERVHGDRTVKVLEIITEGDHAYLVMDLLEGRVLGEYVKEKGFLKGPLLWFASQGLVEALQSIHTAGVVHRDLKPSNIIYGPDGVKVLDFGISGIAEESELTQTGALIGTAAWISPEQVLGEKVTTQSDIFNLGLVMAFMATGVHPFGEGRSDAIMFRVANSEPDLEKVPEVLRGVIERCLCKKPADRPTLSELASFFESNEGEGLLHSQTDMVPPDSTVIIQPKRMADMTSGSSVPSSMKVKSKKAVTSLLIVGGLAAAGFFGGIFDDFVDDKNSSPETSEIVSSTTTQLPPTTTLRITTTTKEQVTTTLPPTTTTTTTTTIPLASGTLLFDCIDNNGDTQICASSADGSYFRQLTSSPYAEYPLAWAPDGNGIIFSRPWVQSGIFELDDDGSINEIGSTDASVYPGFNSGLTVSPDGSQMIWSGRSERRDELFIMNADGTGYRELTNNNRHDWEPDWSPDGNKIVMTQYLDLCILDLITMEEKIFLKRQTNVGFRFPQWSPDGEWIAFVGEPPNLTDSDLWDGNSAIYLIRADGTDSRRLTSTDHDNDFYYGRLLWSPDGTQISYSGYYRDYRVRDQLPRAISAIIDAVTGEEIIVLTDEWREGATDSVTGLVDWKP